MLDLGGLAIVGDTAEFGEQRCEMGDDLIVRDAIRGEDPVSIMQVATVVPKFEAEQIRHFAAGFLQNYLRGTCVPKLGSRTWVNIEIRFAISDQRNLKADRAAADRSREAEMRDYLLHPIARVISRDRDAHFF